MPTETFSEADFRILGLEPGADRFAVKQAYRNLAKKWHPDRFHTRPYEIRALAEDKFREINEAYERIAASWQKKPAQKAGSKPGFDRSRVAKIKVPRARPPRPAGPAWSSRLVRIAAGGLFILVCIAALMQLPSFYSGPANENAQDRGSGDHADSGRGKQADQESDAPNPAEPDPAQAPVPAPPLLQAIPESQPESAPQFFTIGSNASEVLLIQGAPTRVHGQTWVYGLSEVFFKNGQVWKYNNFDGSLKVRLEPRLAEGKSPPSHITLGSTEDEVLAVQGTPTRIEGEKWYYGFAEVRFKDGRLREYDNYFGNLKIRLLPSNSSVTQPRRSFTIGSTPDEVLAVQGTPTSIHGNSWTFDFSNVFFRDGKVQQVSNTDGVLRFVPPMESAGNS